MKLNRFRFVFIVFTLLFSCSSDDNNETPEDDPQNNKPNILLIIADDMGLDATPSYNFGNIKPNMPGLELM